MNSRLFEAVPIFRVAAESFQIMNRRGDAAVEAVAATGEHDVQARGVMHVVPQVHVVLVHPRQDLRRLAPDPIAHEGACGSDVYVENVHEECAWRMFMENVHEEGT